jgi:hypothetical protein
MARLPPSASLLILPPCTPSMSARYNIALQHHNQMFLLSSHDRSHHATILEAPSTLAFPSHFSPLLFTMSTDLPANDPGDCRSFPFFHRTASILSCCCFSARCLYVLVAAVQEAVQNVAPQPFETDDGCMSTRLNSMPETGGRYNHDHTSSGCSARAS